ncbi:MAG: hypothetical protein K0R29_730 [Pseudobdellovibrio sp.]|nr:hypothetical protein [Pseudobdellovibrio sp.]
MKPITETSFKIPGKTFLVGEYAVLLGGPALGLATAPCFEFTVAGSNAVTFHPESPAGKYLAKHESLSAVSFSDPYSAAGIRGGFGRSTAEYLAAITPDLLEKKSGVYDILKEYKGLHADQKVRPSGIDLVFQYLGGVILADQQLQMFQNFEWNFLNLDFALIYSGIKVPTHDHLATIDLEQLNELPSLASQICNLYAANNENEFLYLITQWSELLKAKKLTHPHSLEIRTLLESTGVIKHVKPCGALGADVLIAFFDRADKKQVQQMLAEKKYHYVAGSGDLAAGLASQLRPYWSQNVG